MQEGCGCPPATPGSDRPDVAHEGVEDALLAIGVAVHRPARGEWGITLPCAGWPLHVGLRSAGGWLRVQAEVAHPGALSPAWLLHRNRRALLQVRFGSSAAGATWVHGELPAEAATADRVDELLGRLLEAAEDARAQAGAVRPGAGAPPPRARA